MQTTKRTAQPAEIAVYRDSSVTGPNTKWLPPEPTPGVHFPIEHLAGDAGQVGGQLAQLDPAILGAVGGSEEYATPISRAKGQLLRLIPFSAVWLILTGGVVWVLGLTFPYLLVGFAVLTAATYVRMNGQEFEHSRNGLERHRIDAATDLREKELDQTHELKRLALDGYLRHLEGRQGQ
jgi:hypothetical protein